jgi:multidrug resistance efflux pump
MTTVGLSRLKPAAPSVDRQVIYSMPVERGTLIRKVRGPGNLVPEDILLVPAVTSGRVERKLVEPGDSVDENTLLLVLSNPNVQLELLSAQQQYAAAVSRLAEMETDLEGQRLQLESVVAASRTNLSAARRSLALAQRLYDDSLGSEEELTAAQEVYDEAETRLRTDQARLENLAESIPGRIQRQQAEIDRIADIVSVREVRQASMMVYPSRAGVLQSMPLEEGQWILEGQQLARVVQPGRLKAELRIPEVQARDIVIGQTALIDTRSDTIMGRVARIDPAATNGAVLVDVSLPDELPRSARPDLSIEGIVEIERLNDVLYTGRPAFGQANSRVGLFKIVPNANEAVRVVVQLGVSSVQEVQIIDGLVVGDTVILSDMSQWDAVDRVRLR